MPSLLCPACSTPIDPSGPGVCGFRREGGWADWWAPFIEDLRTSPGRIMHATCYAQEYGLEALLGLIHANDTRQRQYASDLHHELMRLRPDGPATGQ
jgi:hypothetical protein